MATRKLTQLIQTITGTGFAGTGFTGSRGEIGYTGSAGTSPNGSISSGVTTYLNTSNLPVSSNVGDFAFVTDIKTLYIWDGTTWERVYHGPDEILQWVIEPASSYNISLTSPTSNITVQANDPEGFPISYSYNVNPIDQTQMTISNSGGLYTLHPNVNSTPGDVTLRFIATDGVHVSSRTSILKFSLGSVTGIKVNQTSYSYGHTVWRLICLGVVDSGEYKNIFDDTTIRSEALVDASSWGTRLPISTSHATGYFSSYFISKAQTYDVSLPNPYYIVGPDESAANASISVKWTTPIQVRQILISGDMTNNYNYFNGGTFQLYINNVLDPTVYTFISDGNNNFYYNFN